MKRLFPRSVVAGELDLERVDQAAAEELRSLLADYCVSAGVVRQVELTDSERDDLVAEIALVPRLDDIEP